MLSTEASRALHRLFRRTPVADIDALYRALKTQTRMTVFRHLKEAGYLTSYTHSGRYYTLAEVPRFDEHGLWLHQGIGFSKTGTLKDTLKKLVDDAEAGWTHPELRRLLCVRVHNTLLTLVREEKIGRESIDKLYLYVSSQRRRAQRQASKRRELMRAEREALPLSATTVIEILVEVVQIGQRQVARADVVAKRLSARGIVVTTLQVQEVFVRYGLEPEKKGD